MLDAIQDQGPESIITLMTPEPGAAAGARVHQRARLAPDRRQRRVPGLEPGLLHHLGQVQPRHLDGRLVPGGPDAHLALQPRLHEHPLVPLRRRVPLQRRRGRDHRARLQPLGHPCRLPRPVRIGTDAALALSMCKVIIDDGLYNKSFVQEQTDLSLLVRTDNGSSCAATSSTRATATTSSSGWTRRPSRSCRRRAARWPWATSTRRSKARSKVKLIDGRRSEVDAGLRSGSARS